MQANLKAGQNSLYLGLYSPYYKLLDVMKSI